MTSYQPTTLGKLKGTSSGINVKVNAMPFSRRSDGNGGFICDLAKDGDLVVATIDEDIHRAMGDADGVYEVTGEWKGSFLDVHNAEITTEFPRSTEEPPGNLYHEDSSDPYADYQKMKKFKPQ